MFAHLLDHFVFSSRRLTTKAKWIAFGICSSSIFLTFWWFRGVAFGMNGPIAEHWGLQWRKVGSLSSGSALILMWIVLSDLEYLP